MIKFSLPVSVILATMILASCGNTVQTPTETTQSGSAVMMTEHPTHNEMEPASSTEDNTDAENTHTETVTYTVPSGPAEVEFTVVTDANNVISNVDAVFKSAQDTHMTPHKIAGFDAAIDAAVVGKALSEIADIDAVGGASLTTQAFKQYISTLQ